MAGDCNVDHQVEHVLLGDVVVEEDALEQAACFEGAGARLEGEEDGFEVYQEHFFVVYSQGKVELSGEVEELKEEFYFFLYLFGQLSICEQFIPLFSHWIAFESICNDPGSPFDKIELHWTE